MRGKEKNFPISYPSDLPMGCYPTASEWIDVPGYRIEEGDGGVEVGGSDGYVRRGNAVGSVELMWVV